MPPSLGAALALGAAVVGSVRLDRGAGDGSQHGLCAGQGGTHVGGVCC